MTVEISQIEAEKCDDYMNDSATRFLANPKANMKKVENGTVALLTFGNLSEKLEDVVKQIGERNTEILFKKVFGDSYDKAEQSFEKKNFGNNGKLLMAVVYRMRMDSTKQEQEIYTKPTIDITAGEVLELTVQTLNNILMENDIKAEIKLQKN